MFKGLLLKESLKRYSILNLITITGKEIWNINNRTDTRPGKWTALSFEGPNKDADYFAQEMARVMKPVWYANFSTEEIVYVIFENKYFKYPKGNRKKRQIVENYALSVGIPATQVDWSE